MSRKDVEKALKLCGSPMTYSQFWKKVKLTEEQRKAKANACVHFLTGVPNSSEGWAFIKQLKKYLHKIKDSNSPGYNDSKVYRLEQKFRSIRGDLQVIKNQIDEILNEDK